MKRLRARLLTLALPACLLLGGALASCGGDAPLVIGDVPAVTVHTDQRDIDEVAPLFKTRGVDLIFLIRWIIRFLQPDDL